MSQLYLQMKDKLITSRNNIEKLAPAIEDFVNTALEGIKLDHENKDTTATYYSPIFYIATMPGIKTPVRIICSYESGYDLEHLSDLGIVDKHNGYEPVIGLKICAHDSFYVNSQEFLSFNFNGNIFPDFQVVSYKTDSMVAYIKSSIENALNLFCEQSGKNISDFQKVNEYQLQI